jgi:hypothetical protein
MVGILKLQLFIVAVYSEPTAYMQKGDTKKLRTPDYTLQAG